ncbi:MAG: Lrp/AsnC family transcriptional regulator [Thaumarchaeota archaeon]|nr:Lrp/AsnC family transcriptional regulator [Nitrososphaerota archaeon]
MDKLDFALLREILGAGKSNLPIEGPRKSCGVLARKLAVDENTVRRRMRRFQDSGFVTRWTLKVNPQLLGLNEAQMWVDFDDKAVSKKSVMEKVALVQGVVKLKEFLGPSFSAIMLYERADELTRTIELISKIAGSSKDVLLTISSYPKCPIALSPTDVRIIQALQENPWMRYNELSKSLKISARTIRRHFRRLVENHAVFTQPMIDATVLEGTLMANLLVFYDGSDEQARINERIILRIGDGLLLPELHREHSFFCFAAKSVSEIEEMSEFLRSMRGVKSHRIKLVCSIVNTGLYSPATRRRDSSIFIPLQTSSGRAR